MTELLVNGDVDGRYASRSEVEMAIALAAANARWTIHDLRVALLDDRNEGGAGVRTRRRNGAPRMDSEERIQRLWAKAQARIQARPRVADLATVRAELAEIRNAADARPRRWSSQGGVTDRAVLAALLEVADGALTLTPSCSARQLAERANVSHQTVTASLRRLLRTREFVRLERPASGTMAAQYRLLRPEPREDDLEDDGGGGDAPWSSDRSHDAFAFRGLGRVGARIFDFLIDHRATPDRALAARTGLHVRTVRRYLERLHAAGLAERRPGGWVRGRADLDAVARDLGTFGDGLRRRERHAAERGAYVDYVVDFLARRGWAVERGLYRPQQRRLPFPTAGAEWPASEAPAA